MVSPHLDVAVLYADGRIAMAPSLGIDVMILTVFTGKTPTDEHGRWMTVYQDLM